jgi:hypothetical protein
MEELIKVDSAYYPSPPDTRDYSLYQIGIDTTKALPQRVMLPKPPFTLDQLDNPFCVGSTMAGIMNTYYKYFDILPEQEGFSQAYAYWRCKELDGIPDTPGTFPRVMLKVANKEGVPPESLLRITPSMEKPVLTDRMKNIAANFKIKGYARLDEFGRPENTINNIKQALASGKYVFVGTIVTSENWMEKTKEDGFLGLPKGFILGGHATWLKGYDDNLSYRNYKGYFRGKNSWGNVWGDAGSYWMPYDYVKWEMADIPGFVSFQEAWAIEFEKIPEPVKERIELTIGSKDIVLNGKKIAEMDIPARIENGRTILELRGIGEVLGASFDWEPKDGKTEKVYIYR